MAIPYGASKYRIDFTSFAWLLLLLLLLLSCFRNMSNVSIHSNEAHPNLATCSCARDFAPNLSGLCCSFRLPVTGFSGCLFVLANSSTR